METLLLVDDDVSLLESLTLHFEEVEKDGQPRFTVVTATTAAAGLERAKECSPSLVVLDMMLPDRSGLELIEEMRALCGDAPIVLVTAYHDMESTIRAMKLGAFDYIHKPFADPAALDLVVGRALSIRQLSRRAATADQEHPVARLGDVVGQTPVMQQLVKEIGKVAAAPKATVLITGESGTGKELVARVVHNYSFDEARPFVGINCSAIVDTLLESELFGHEKGSFTGATRAHRGLFMSADGGTLMLDEIGDMPMRLQVKLLRVLQENVIRPVGSTDGIPVNVRVISATHRDLQQLMSAGQFREDLYYRLNVVHIEMPSLNRRREDIPLLVAHFLAQIARESGVRKIYAPEAVELLATADWPGNIRQLHNVVRQNVALSQTPIIPVELVQQSLGGSPGRLPSFDEARDEFTRSYLSQILQITGGNVSQAARLARRNRTDFYKLLARHQLTPEEFKQR
jgi:DNA-binding NtrC family response regulator